MKKSESKGIVSKVRIHDKVVVKIFESKNQVLRCNLLSVPLPIVSYFMSGMRSEVRLHTKSRGIPYLNISIDQRSINPHQI